MYTIRKGEYVKCACCGKELYRSQWQLRLNKNHFCNYECKNIFQKRPMKYEIIDNYAKFEIKDKNNILYGYIDIEDLHLLDHQFFVIYANKNKDLAGIQDFKGNKLYRLIMKCPKNLCVDHINHNPLDNRKSNLRICTKAQNNQNKRGCSITSTTKIRNVYFQKDYNKYFVKVKRTFGGYFPNTKEGLELARLRAIELRKELMPYAT